MKTANFFHDRSIALLIALSISLSLVRCAPAATEVPPTPSATVVVPTASQMPTTLPTQTLVPTETVIPFVPKATIKIASQSPLSGEYALAGTGVMRGAELAVKQLTVPLMGLGYEVELIPYDDQNDLGLAVTIAKKIVADPDTLCVVGPYASRILNQVKEIYHQAGLAFVSPSATAAFATGSSYLEVNRVVGRHDAQGAVGAQFANAKGFERVFVINPSCYPFLLKGIMSFSRRECR